MKMKIISGIILVCFVLAGCGKKIDSAANPSLVKQQDTTPATTATIQPVLTAWQQGDQSGAISNFLETDWSSRPLFTPGSALSLNEKQFGSLPSTDRDAKANEMLDQLGVLKHLLAAVTQAGNDAAAKNEVSTARKYFTSLKQFGEALDSPDSLATVKLVGQRVKKNADDELAKLGQ